MQRDEVSHNAMGRDTLIPRLKLNDTWSIIEVGSWVGYHALQLAHAGFQVYCVDTWGGTRKDRGDATSMIAEAIGSENVYGTFLRNVREHLFRKIVPCRGSSQFWAANWPFQVDAVFIDADHSYEGVMDDLKSWWPYVRPGGIFCGHDWNCFPTVGQAVEQWLKDTPGEGSDVLVEQEVWFRQKNPVS